MLVGIKKTNGFTLIELLVVISIIALLLSILMPGLQKAKQHALTTICMSQQKQASLANITYGTENNNYNVPSWTSTYPDPPAKQWFTFLRSYMDTAAEGMYQCPKAKNLDPTLEHSGGFYGSAKAAWNVDTDVHEEAIRETRGGFGYNNWLESKETPAWVDRGVGMPRQTDVPDPYLVPTFGDCTWPDAGWVIETDIIPPEEEDRESPEAGDKTGGWVYRFSMTRHGDGINLAFMDGHGEKAVEVDDLLSFKWHKSWNSSLVDAEAPTE
ncbi:MAG: type II secretion system protein [Planctomycetota bacterium]|jgi:prepilin-type N-terminal cleavage/methylation domain-containing protein/prepilin-type processing-associated H-X9-DG protein